MKKAGLLFLVMIVIAVVTAGIGYWKLTGEESDTLRKIVLSNVCPTSRKTKTRRHVRKSNPTPDTWF